MKKMMTETTRRIFCKYLCALGTSVMVGKVYSRTLPHLLPSGTALACHPDFSRFDNNSAETYERTQWIDARLKDSGIAAAAKSVNPITNPIRYIKKVHTRKHISLIEKYPTSGTFKMTLGQASRMAVGYVLGATEAVCNGSVRNAFCSIRPPGHHAQNSGPLGFCCYANVVIAALYARKHFNLHRIMIVDWDYHQGNGTHGHICKDDNTLFFDTFGRKMYTTECNDFTPVQPDHVFSKTDKRMCIQMPAGSGNDDFIRLYEQSLIPAAEQFKPELVLISCGFDCKKNDALGRFTVTAKGISRLTLILKQIADTYANGRLVSILEGGYMDTEHDRSIPVPGNAFTFSGLAQCAESHVATLISGNEQAESAYFKTH